MEFWAFILLGIGLVFILLEVFFPSFGLLGSIAAGCLIGGAVLAWRSQNDIFGTYLLLVFVLGPAVSMLALKVWPKTPMGKAMTLEGSTFDPREAAPGGIELDKLLGKSGVAITPLRPAGKALIETRRIDVLTRGEMIDPGAPIEVVRVEGNRVFVAEVRTSMGA
jgi:membrane-bound serine protease (ClpP class)